MDTMVSLNIHLKAPGEESRTFVRLLYRSGGQHLEPDQAARWIEEAFPGGMYERGL